MATDLTQFGLTEMLRCSAAIRQGVAGAATTEGAAKRVCEVLYRYFGGDDPAADPQCALVRLYKTHRFEALEPSLRVFAKKRLGTLKAPKGMRCLCLLATRGDEPGWNDRRASHGHQAIPLPTTEMVEQAPMVAQLVRQFGLDLADVVAPRPEVMAAAPGRSYGVFHVEDAQGSPFIPAQDFVERYGIRSVVGFGGALRSADIFAVILFSRVPIARDTAERFRTMALDVKSALFNFDDDAVFEPSR